MLTFGTDGAMFLYRLFYDKTNDVIFVMENKKQSIINKDESSSTVI